MTGPSVATTTTSHEGPQLVKRLEQVYIEQSVWCGLEREACVKGCLPSMGHLQGRLCGMGEMVVVESMVRIPRNMNSLLKWTLDGAEGGIGFWFCLNDADGEDEGMLGNYSLSPSLYPQFLLKVERQLVSRVGDDLDPFISITAWSWPDQRQLSLHLLDQPCIPINPCFSQTPDFFIQEYFQLIGKSDHPLEATQTISLSGELQRLSMLKTCLRIQLQSRIQHLEEAWRERKRSNNQSLDVEGDAGSEEQGHESVPEEQQQQPASENHFYHLLNAMATRDLPLVHSDWLRKRPLQPSQEKPSLALRSLRTPSTHTTTTTSTTPSAFSEPKAAVTSVSSNGGKRERRSKAIIANGNLVTPTNGNGKPRPILPLLPSPSSNLNADGAHSDIVE